VTATVAEPDITGLGLGCGDLTIAMFCEFLLEGCDMDMVTLQEALPSRAELTKSTQFSTRGLR